MAEFSCAECPFRTDQIQQTQGKAVCPEVAARAIWSIYALPPVKSMGLAYKDFLTEDGTYEVSAAYPLDLPAPKRLAAAILWQAADTIVNGVIPQREDCEARVGVDPNALTLDDVATIPAKQIVGTMRNIINRGLYHFASSEVAHSRSQ